MASKEKRRTDARVPVNSEPFWFSSSIIVPADAGSDLVLKDFQLADGTYMILGAGVEVIEAFDGSASLVVGLGTMATKALGTVTAVDADELLISADITEATIGFYPASGSALVTALGAGTPPVIKGLDAVVPVVYAALTASSPTVGKARVHLLLTKVPLVPAV